MTYSVFFGTVRIVIALLAVSLALLQAQPVTTVDLENAAVDNSSWLSYGRDYHAQRYVDLKQITPANVDRLQPAWAFATGGENRGLEATPLLHEGVLYISADGSRVFAIDARTGAKKWSYDPKLADETERVYCCGSINRSVALFANSVFVGTMDARLVALNKDTGKVQWESEVADWRQGYSITGAPLIVKDMVLTGMAGGEFGTRGFVKAFDAKTGEVLSNVQRRAVERRCPRCRQGRLRIVEWLSALELELRIRNCARPEMSRPEAIDSS